MATIKIMKINKGAVGAYALTLALIGCGGGGGDSSPSAAPVALADPKLTVYSGFDLGSSILTGVDASNGVYGLCLNNTNQIDLHTATINPNRTFGSKVFNLYGTFSMPKGSSSCSTTGVVGTITAVTLVVDSNIVYGITGLNLPGSAFTLGYKPFWQAVAEQTGKVMSGQLTSSVVTCTNSANVAHSLSLSTPGDVAEFIKVCIQ
jgi:hypothetical protein